MFIYLDGPVIVKNTSVMGWKKFRKINSLVSTNYKGCFNIIRISFYMVGQALWLNIMQYINKSIVQVDRHTYSVTYVIKGNTYTMIIKPNRGPRKVLLVSDETHTDVSNIIFPYLGPNENFHGGSYTPNFFNKSELVFELSDGTEKTFFSEDIMII